MKKESFADKIARKSFESSQFQQSWQVHMQAFGPILEHAFEGNYQARIHLTAALNHISSRNLAQGLAKLKLIQKDCITDADKTAFLFFMGVYSEMAGNTEQMIAFYTYANEYGHRFYMPYMKVGKFYLDHHDYGPAFENYQAAIACFSATGLDEKDKLILGSAYTNLASCLTMMHRYDEAEEALSTSRSLYPDAPGRAAVEAVLHALHGDREQVDACLNTLKAHVPAAVDSIRESTEKILEKKDPLFFPFPIPAEKVTAFWDWFRGYSPELIGRLDKEEYESALTPIGETLLAHFPFLEEPLVPGVGRNEKGYVLELRDCYAVAVVALFETLLAACPEEITETWQFAVVH